MNRQFCEVVTDVISFTRSDYKPFCETIIRKMQEKDGSLSGWLPSFCCTYSVSDAQMIAVSPSSGRRMASFMQAAAASAFRSLTYRKTSSAFCSTAPVPFFSTNC